MIRKSMPSDLIRGWVPVFPRDKREAFARRSCSNKKIERDDDSKQSHPALDVDFQEVVDSILTEEAEVVEAIAIPGRTEWTPTRMLL
jgi:hypothetical protein